MDKLDAMRVFCSVIEAGGFAAAADQLGISSAVHSCWRISKRPKPVWLAKHGARAAACG